ncbi:NAD(P)-binding protein [Dichomitus squalens]|uniref:NAD(P)-binding protein n=1 Tax=Dichomitus squalens TaxID=114155 RepID=A0A4V2K1W2_9APHY|nr:NAD(P)-binding protein [Dichomitus squalens]
MPASTTGKVLVTGANGFIAGWIIKDLLEQGFIVRGTVRSLEKAEGLRKALSAHGDRLEIFVVEDIAESGAFDKAVEGIDAIVHAASPVHVLANDPEELIRPALQGTTSILRSASQPDSTVKRIVVISSLAAIVDISAPTPVTFTEANWNEHDVAEVRDKGAAAAQSAKYRASKALAERAAWDLFREGRDKGTIGWDLVTLCPPWVFGPVLGVQSPNDLHSSVKTWYEIAVKEEGEIPAWSKANWVDVRDFAAATRLAITKPEAGGERFVVCTAPFDWGQWVYVARRVLGKSKPEEDIQDFSQIVHDVRFDNKKSREVLGITYHEDMEGTAAFMIQDFKEKGWC